MKRTRLRRRSPLGRRTKFGNIRTEYRGVLYDSKLEADYAATLDLRKRATSRLDRIKSWKRQVPVKLVVNGYLITTYVVDFVVTHVNGLVEYVECKGRWTPEARIKVKLFAALYPFLLTIVRKS